MSDLLGKNPFPHFRFLTQRGTHTQDQREGQCSIVSVWPAGRPLTEGNAEGTSHPWVNP